MDTMTHFFAVLPGLGLSWVWDAEPEQSTLLGWTLVLALLPHYPSLGSGARWPLLRAQATLHL